MDEQFMNEQDFKQKLITNFNQIESGWIDGDSEKPNEKTPDILNHSLKIARCYVNKITELNLGNK